MRNAPLALITVGLGAAGTGKLAGAQVTKDNFSRWGYPASARIVVEAIEVGVAATGLSAFRSPKARPEAALARVLRR